jgi:hypothetical protein
MARYAARMREDKSVERVMLYSLIDDSRGSPRISE